MGELGAPGPKSFWKNSAPTHHSELAYTLCILTTCVLVPHVVDDLHHRKCFARWLASMNNVNICSSIFRRYVFWSTIMHGYCLLGFLLCFTDVSRCWWVWLHSCSNKGTIARLSYRPRDWTASSPSSSPAWTGKLTSPLSIPCSTSFFASSSTCREVQMWAM